MLLAVAVLLQSKFDIIRKVGLSLFGPPQVAMKETFAGTSTTLPIDHSVLDSLLKQYVDSAGWVDYAGIRGDATRLDQYLQSVADADLNALGRDDRLAFLINANNRYAFLLPWRLARPHVPASFSL